jgi:dTDP-4-amino-4,6-dideoxygalactose transaminase
VRTLKRDALRAHLAERGVSTDVHYPLPAHLQAPYAEFAAGPGSLPNTERLAEEILSLPIHPELSDDDVDYVASQVRGFAASR